MGAVTNDDIEYVITHGPLIGITAASRNRGHEPQSLIYHLHKLGLTITRNAQSYRVNADLFCNITSPEVAYVLGLLWADGHVRKTYYEIVIEADATDLAEIRWVFDRLGDWDHSIRVRKGRTKAVAKLRTSNPLIHSLLKETDYLVKSTASPDKILARIPTDLHRFFWRGYIDGDGCFYFHVPTCQLTLAGSFQQDWRAHEQMLSSMGVPYNIKHFSKQAGKSSILRVCSRPAIVNLGNWLYNGYETDHIGLRRKWEKYKAIADYDCLKRAA
jgi:hypothetical protein